MKTLRELEDMSVEQAKQILSICSMLFPALNQVDALSDDDIYPVIDWLGECPIAGAIMTPWCMAGSVVADEWFIPLLMEATNGGKDKLRCGS